MDLSQRQKVGSGGPYEDLVGYSRVLVTGPFAYVAGTTAGSDGSAIPPGIVAQTRQTVEIIRQKLAQVSYTLDDVVRVRMFVMDIKRDWEQVACVMNEYFAEIKPVMTMVQVAALIDEQMLIEVEMDAVAKNSIAILGSDVPYNSMASKEYLPDGTSPTPHRRTMLHQHDQQPSDPEDPAEPSFYSENVDRYAAKNHQRVTLRSLLHMCEPPLTREGLLSNAQYLCRERPVRYAKRVKLFQQLPYIVNLNPHINEVYKIYYGNFEESRKFPMVQSTRDQEQFVDMLARQSRVLRDIMPDIARGFYECQRYFGTDERSRFLDQLIKMRIGLRLLTSQYIAQYHQYQATLNGEYEKETENHRYQGIIDNRLYLAEMVHLCAQSVQAMCDMTYGQAPDFIIDGQTDVSFRYIPSHLHYMLTELLKNAFRATLLVAKDNNKHRPVLVTVSEGSGRVAIRIRDYGGGIPLKIHPRIFDYSFTTVTHHSMDDEPLPGSTDGTLGSSSGAQPPIAGLGFGLPMTKVYAEYFGGSLNLISMEGYGCDAFIELPSIDLTKAPKIQI
ncbi:hypothetical protein IWW45_004542 [Coemansia sp. RSA 485]|nr:hypothetical protein IWW45_004542 [Coemansia sp. RSA 485]